MSIAGPRFAAAVLTLLSCAAAGACAATAAAPPPGTAPQPSGASQAPRTIVQPGAPGQPSRTVAAADAPLFAITHTAADVAFMQGMIGHHAQAVEMTELLKTRTESADMKLLAKRIEVSQTDEIRFMQRWLTSRGETVPGPHAHHAPGAKLMPGMLSPADMARLTAASGVAFDKLFLEYMIKHHQGALIMVDELFASDGAGQEGDIHAFASDVVADQQMEIDRMGGMLGGLSK